MLYWAFVFLIVALVAGALGLGGLAGTAAGIAASVVWHLYRSVPYRAGVWPARFFMT